MGIIKIFFLLIIFVLAIYIGNEKANKFINREKELISIKSALNIFENKIKFTQSPLEEIFKNLAQNCTENNIKKIFKRFRRRNKK